MKINRTRAAAGLGVLGLAASLAACSSAGSTAPVSYTTFGPSATPAVNEAVPEVDRTNAAGGSVAACRAAVARGLPLNVPACAGVSYAQVSSALPSSPPSTAAAVKTAAPTVTYEVTGSPAGVTYGPAGSTASGAVPLKVTQKLGDPLYYALTAQLQGGGNVTCDILVNGSVVSKSTASGGYNIASCEISQDVLTGQWTDTNS